MTEISQNFGDSKNFLKIICSPANASAWSNLFCGGVKILWHPDFNKWLPLSVWCWGCKVLWLGRGKAIAPGANMWWMLKRWAVSLASHALLKSFEEAELKELSWCCWASPCLLGALGWHRAPRALLFSQEFYKVLVSPSITTWCVSVFAPALGDSCPACCCGRAVFALPRVTLLQFAFSKPWRPSWRADVITCWVQGVFALLFAFSVCLCESLLLWISPAREVKQMFIHNLPG